MERISRYREILTREPQSRVYVPLADLLRQHGETEEALVLLEEGLVRNPEHQSALVVLGCTLLQAHRFDHGEKVLNRVLELSPDNFVVLRALAEHYLARDDFSRAVPMLEALVGFEPDHAEWEKMLNDARERLLQDKASVQSAEVPASPEAVNSESETENKKDPVSPPKQKTSDKTLATMTLVDIMVSQGYMDKALAALERMRDAEPHRSDIQERLTQLKSGAFSPGSLSASAGEPSAEEMARRRAGQKKQFGEWIENFKSDGGPSS